MRGSKRFRNRRRYSVNNMTLHWRLRRKNHFRDKEDRKIEENRRLGGLIC